AIRSRRYDSTISPFMSLPSLTPVSRRARGGLCSPLLADRAPRTVRAAFVTPEDSRLSIETVIEGLSPPPVAVAHRLSGGQAGHLALRAAVRAAGLGGHADRVGSG